MFESWKPVDSQYIEEALIKDFSVFKLEPR